LDRGFQKVGYTYNSLFIYLWLDVICSYISSLLPNSSVHSMNTRQQNKLHMPSVRLSSIQRGVYYTSVKIFNQHPQNIFKFHNNIHTFKTLLTDYLVKNAFYSNEEFLSTGHNNVDTKHFCIFQCKVTNKCSRVLSASLYSPNYPDMFRQLTAIFTVLHVPCKLLQFCLRLGWLWVMVHLVWPNAMD
jgi:hypothetical protein